MVVVSKVVVVLATGSSVFVAGAVVTVIVIVSGAVVVVVSGFVVFGALFYVFGVATGIITDFMVAGSTSTRQAAFTPTKPKLNTRLFYSVPKNPISCRSSVKD